jgi:hypothetical protein
MHINKLSCLSLEVAQQSRLLAIFLLFYHGRPALSLFFHTLPDSAMASSPRIGLASLPTELIKMISSYVSTLFNPLYI